MAEASANRIGSSFICRFAGLFEIDTRSLAAFRISVGLILIADLVIRASALEAHYTDAGVMPIEMIADRYWGMWRWSLHFLGGSASYQGFLFAIAGIAATCLTVGFHSRLASVICWAMCASIQTRTPLLQNGGDDLLRMLLFWAMFLPLPSRSFAWTRAASSRSSVSTLASAAILLQVCLMYFVAGSWKLAGGWASSNELYQILHYDSYARPFAYALQGFPGLSAITGKVVVFVELVFPFLLLVPAKYWKTRCFAVATFGMLHLGIECTLTVGFFSYVCWAALLLFLPREFWNRLFRIRWLSNRGTVASTVNHDGDHRVTLKSIATGGVVLVAMLIVLVWNVSERGILKQQRIPVAARRIGELLALQQDWRLFHRAPERDGWYMVLGQLNNEDYVDLLRDGIPVDDITFTKPVFAYRLFPNLRWRKLHRNLVDDRRQPFRETLCRYLAGRWNRNHKGRDAVVAIELQYMQELDTDDESDGYMQRFLCTYTVDGEQNP